MTRRVSPLTAIRPRAVGLVGQLTRFEGRRAFRSPLLWLGFVVSLALVWVTGEDVPATLDWRSVAVAGSCLPLAAVALLQADQAAARQRSRASIEVTTPLPTPVDLSMLGVIGAAWAPALLATVVTAIGVVVAFRDDPAGSIRIAELAVGPLVVVLGQAFGAGLGRWIGHPLAALLTLAIVSALFMTQLFLPGPREIPAASPFLPWQAPYTDFVQGEPRLPGIHLAYLAALTGVAAAVATRRWRGLIAAGAMLLATVWPLSLVEIEARRVVAAVEVWAESQPSLCEMHDGVRFCAIAGYRPWIDDWVAAVESLEDLVPGELALREVEQTTGHWFEDTDPTLAHVGGRSTGRGALGDLAGQVLPSALGLPGTPAEAAEMNSELPACMARILPMLVSGQARGVALILLTELAAPGSVHAYMGPAFQLGQVEISAGEVALAMELMGRPRDQILPTLERHWDRIVDPNTTSAELAGWFGLEPPQVLTAPSAAGMECMCTADGGVSCTRRSASG